MNKPTVPPEVVAAVIAFANANGRTWRAKLRSLWNSGRDTGLLRQARNTIGPSGIDRLKINPVTAEDLDFGEPLEAGIPGH